MNHIVVLEAFGGPGLGLNGLIYLLFFENVGPWLLMGFFTQCNRGFFFANGGP